MWSIPRDPRAGVCVCVFRFKNYASFGALAVPRDVDLLERPPKFKKQILLANVNRIKVIVQGFTSYLGYVKRTFEFQYGTVVVTEAKDRETWYILEISRTFVKT